MKVKNYGDYEDIHKETNVHGLLTFLYFGIIENSSINIIYA